MSQLFSLINETSLDSASIYADGRPAVPLIDGVYLHESRAILSESGTLTELFRRDWWAIDGSANSQVDQVFMRTLRVGEASGWHVHAETTDRLTVIAGTLKVLLYDDRPASVSYRQSNTFLLGAIRPQLLVIPPGVWHAIRTHADQDVTLLNMVDLAYRYEAPDHFRLPLDTPLIPVRI